jgi:hypothetical protein
MVVKHNWHIATIMAEASFVLSPLEDEEDERSWLDIPVETFTHEEHEAKLSAALGRQIKIAKYPASGTTEEKEAFTEAAQRAISAALSFDSDDEENEDEEDEEEVLFPVPTLGEFYQLHPEDIGVVVNPYVAPV